MQHKLHKTLKTALLEKGENINLYGCNLCGFVFNQSFDPKKTKYSEDYDNTQDYSPYFYKYLTKKAIYLINRYQLKNKKVVEIGCGKGHFLKLLFDLGVKNIRGFDPAYVNYDPIIDRLVLKKFFNKKNVKEPVDFIICRHVLEHITQPKDFISSIIDCLKNKGTMYFEFPSLEWIVKNKVFFDFFYEHCNYFTKNTVVKLFSQLGFNNLVFKYGLNKQYFQLEIGRSNKICQKQVNISYISNFINKEVVGYKKLIDSLGNFVVWGGGAKGVTFLNRLKIDYKKSRYLIDINPNKQNKYIPITGQKIVAPEILKKVDFDAILIMNPVYEKEIKSMAKKYNFIGRFILV